MADVDPEALRRARVVLADGTEQSLGELVDAAGGPVVLVFLRHFGCVGCSEQVTVLAPRLAELGELGASTVFIGHGSADQLAGFVERHNLAGKRAHPVTNPDRSAYEAAGLRRSLWSAIGPRGLWGELRGTGRGYERRGIEGDVAQQGGALVLDESGRVRLHHVGEATGDNADPNELVRVALTLAAKRGRERGALLV